MLPATFTPFFAASTGAAGALIGLLFIAISIAPERTVGKTATPERAALAGSAFTALTNVFFISLVALVPEQALGTVAVIMGLVSLLTTVRLAFSLLRARPSGKRLTLTQAARRLALVAASLIIYSLELWQGAQMIQLGARDVGSDIAITFLIVSIFGIALVRMWSLLGARKDSILAWLSVVNDLED